MTELIAEPLDPMLLDEIIKVLQLLTPILVTLLAFALYTIRDAIAKLAEKLDDTHGKLLEDYVKKSDHREDLRDVWDGLGELREDQKNLALRVEQNIRPQGQTEGK